RNAALRLGPGGRPVAERLPQRIETARGLGRQSIRRAEVEQRAREPVEQRDLGARRQCEMRAAELRARKLDAAWVRDRDVEPVLMLAADDLRLRERRFTLEIVAEHE